MEELKITDNKSAIPGTKEKENLTVAGTSSMQDAFKKAAEKKDNIINMADYNATPAGVIGKKGGRIKHENWSKKFSYSGAEQVTDEEWERRQAAADYMREKHPRSGGEQISEEEWNQRMENPKGLNAEHIHNRSGGVVVSEEEWNNRVATKEYMAQSRARSGAEQVTDEEWERRQAAADYMREKHPRSGGEQISEEEWNQRMSGNLAGIDTEQIGGQSSEVAPQGIEDAERIRTMVKEAFGHEGLPESAEMRMRMEKSFNELLKAQKSVEAAKQEVGKFNRILSKFGLAGKTGSVRLDYIGKQERLQKAQESFYRDYERFTQSLYQEQRQLLAGKGIVADDPAYKEAMTRLVLVDKVVERKDKEGKVVAFSLLQDFNNRLKEINDAKREALNPADQSIAAKLWDKYKKLSPSKRVALTALICTGVGVAGGMGIAGAATYGGWRFARGLVGGTIPPVVDRFMKGRYERANRQRASERNSELVKRASEGETGFVKQIMDYNKQMRNQNIKRSAVVGASSAALSYGLFSLDMDKLTEIFSSEPPKDLLKPSLQLPSDTASAENSIGVDEGSLSGVENVMDNQEMPIFTHDLEKGQNVWNVLEAHFNGNQKEVAKQLMKFKADAIEALQEQGMDVDKAEKFIDWRFRHLQPGIHIEIDATGALQVEGFSNKNQIAVFEKSFSRK